MEPPYSSEEEEELLCPCHWAVASKTGSDDPTWEMGIVVGVSTPGPYRPWIRIFVTGVCRLLIAIVNPIVFTAPGKGSDCPRVLIANPRAFTSIGAVSPGTAPGIARMKFLSVCILTATPRTDMASMEKMLVECEDCSCPGLSRVKLNT
jgi:hypothetical protein